MFVVCVVHVPRRGAGGHERGVGRQASAFGGDSPKEADPGGSPVPLKSGQPGVSSKVGAKGWDLTIFRGSGSGFPSPAGPTDPREFALSRGFGRACR